MLFVLFIINDTGELKNITQTMRTCYLRPSHTSAAHIVCACAGACTHPASTRTALPDANETCHSPVCRGAEEQGVQTPDGQVDKTKVIPIPKNRQAATTEEAGKGILKNKGETHKKRTNNKPDQYEELRRQRILRNNKSR